MTTMSYEACLTLLAMGWVDGELSQAESDAVMTAARQSNLPEKKLRALENAAAKPVKFSKLTKLNDIEKLTVYGMARWVAKADGTVDQIESQALGELSKKLEISGVDRLRIDLMVSKMHKEVGDVDLIALQQDIRTRILNHR
jgi:tellurite resistance protein